MKQLRKLRIDSVLIAYILNVLDLLFTLYAISNGGIELNPFMRCVPVMIIYKLFVVNVLLWWLRNRAEPIANLGIKLILVVYAGLDLYHIIALLYIHCL